MNVAYRYTDDNTAIIAKDTESGREVEIGFKDATTLLSKNAEARKEAREQLESALDSGIVSAKARKLRIMNLRFASARVAGEADPSRPVFPIIDFGDGMITVAWRDRRYALTRR